MILYSSHLFFKYIYPGGCDSVLQPCPLILRKCSKSWAVFWSLLLGLYVGSHSTGTSQTIFFREALRGHFTLVREEHLKEVPFFKDVTYENFPQNGLPRLPMKICCFNGTPVWGLQGSCSLFVVERLFI